MKKTLLSTIAVALLLAGSASRAAAQGDMKPILVVSLAGYQRIMDDIAFVGKLSDSPDLAKNLEGMITFFTQGQGLAGLDKTKPWGLAASTDGLSFQLLGFVPVTDLKKLLDALSGFLGDPDEEDGVYKIQAGLPIPLYLKEHKGYGYLSQDAASLSNLPDDPTTLLGGLDKQYDVAVRLSVQNIPEVFRQLAIDQIKMGVEGSLEQGPDESDEQFEERSKMTQQQMDALVTTLNELDELTLGLSIDEAAPPDVPRPADDRRRRNAHGQADGIDAGTPVEVRGLPDAGRRGHDARQQQVVAGQHRPGPDHGQFAAAADPVAARRPGLRQ